jgi:hypothetical protein
MNCKAAAGPPGKLVRIWQLAILRFAITRDDGDRMQALAVADEVDRSGGRSDDGFHFFRRTTAELCKAMSGDDAQAEAVIGRFQSQIDDPRLRRAFEAAIMNELVPRRTIGSRIKTGEDLWKGLPPRRATGT